MTKPPFIYFIFLFSIVRLKHYFLSISFKVLVGTNTKKFQSIPKNVTMNDDDIVGLMGKAESTVLKFVFLLIKMKVHSLQIANIQINKTVYIL